MRPRCDPSCDDWRDAGRASEPWSWGALPPSTTVDVVTVDDSDEEVAHTFTVTIALDAMSEPVCVLGTAMATVTIVDNDDPNPALSIADASVIEGTGPGTTTISFEVAPG